MKAQRATAKRPKGALSDYKKSTLATIRSLRQSDYTAQAKIRIAAAVWRFQRDRGVTHSQAFNRVVFVPTK